MGRSLWLLSLVAACYSPTVADGLPCTADTHRCPAGQTCELDTNTCWVTPPPAANFDKLSAGVRHTCGIDPDNVLWCWGDNSFGQLGVGDADPRLFPARVPVMATDGWAHISSGDDATCGIGFAGDLFCWGDGDVVGTQSNTPRQITDPPKWLSVSVGHDGYCAVATDRSTWCNWDGTLTMVDNTIHATFVSASRGRQCVLEDISQKIYCWGRNDRLQVLKGQGDPVTTPVDIPSTVGWDAVSAGPTTTCALDRDAHIWCWGECQSYETGMAPGQDPYCAPTQIGIAQYIHIEVGDDSVCAVSASHNAVCFGLNDWGQLGRSTIEPWALPAPADSAIDFGDIGVGAHHVCSANGRAQAYCWGSNAYGQLGTDEVAFVQTPAQVGADRTWLQVSAGITTTCAVATDHTLWCWGSNGAGQLGEGTPSPWSNAPLEVDSSHKNWYSVSVGSSHICALLGDPAQGSTAWCWGSNSVGQLARNPADTMERVPKQVGSDADWIEIAAGTLESCGIRKNTTGNSGVYCWGDTVEVPTRLSDNIDGFKDLAASASVSVKPDNMFVLNGFLLDDVGSKLPPTTHQGNFADTTSPMMYGLTFFSIARGENHHCAIDNGRLFCYGNNELGQLGTTPTAYEDLSVNEQMHFTDWRSVDVGGDSTCAIRVNDQLYCWGSARTLGVPLQAAGTGVPTPLSGQWSSVSVGVHHVCGIKTDGSLWCWGENALGEVASGATGSARPMHVKPGT